ncbi:MAG TPA: hypothetical protein VHO70_13655 [Chitinispirillaceae bacterium]|nr:hypothetical protein [Chitinispirillaceae bacterium]
MSKPKMSGDTSHFEKLLRQKHYGTMEIMRSKTAREAFKRPAYQTTKGVE